MSYKKNRLNEVDIVESMSDSGFVLGVDENGNIKRVPKSTMSKIKTINGAEPDENGNIEVVGGNENLAGVGKPTFVPSVFQLPDGMTGTINLSAGIEGGSLYGSWMTFDEYLLVNFDGTDYTCKVSRDDFPPSSWATAWAGNYSLCDSTKEDTGEPFFVYLDGDMQGTVWWVADNSVEHTAICRTGKFVTGLIPEEYLPCEKPTAITIPYVVFAYGYAEDDTYDVAKIGGYTLDQVKELMANGCSVSFLQTPENAEDEYAPPLLYTLSGGISNEGSYRDEGLVFTALRCTFMRNDDYDGVSDDLETNLYPTAIVGFWWNGKKVKEFTKTLTNYTTIYEVEEMLLERSKKEHEVGSLYVSMSPTNPAEIFGFGTWNLIAKNSFLVGAGDTYEAGDTGGEETVTLTTEQVPKVEGRITLHNGMVATDVQMVSGCFTSDVTREKYIAQGDGTAGADSIGQIKFSNGGNDEAHNNMPPYIAVYMWQRMS